MKLPRLTPYLFIASIIALLYLSIDTYNTKNPREVIDKGWYTPSDSTID